ncbi:MAG: hypothetical protein II920_07515 [Clostridia bacterium]|nr:hypothetical protein [Clostridia bacterium]
MFESYRRAKVESAFTDLKTPDVIMAMHLTALSASERQQAQEAAQKDIMALECDRCDYRARCAYRDSVARLPVGVKGGEGLCLRYYRDREGGHGFILPSGEPVFLTAEVVAELKAVLR